MNHRGHDRGKFLRFNFRSDPGGVGDKLQAERPGPMPPHAARPPANEDRARGERTLGQGPTSPSPGRMRAEISGPDRQGLPPPDNPNSNYRRPAFRPVQARAGLLGLADIPRHEVLCTTKPPSAHLNEIPSGLLHPGRLS